MPEDVPVPGGVRVAEGVPKPEYIRVPEGLRVPENIRVPKHFRLPEIFGYSTEKNWNYRQNVLPAHPYQIYIKHSYLILIICTFLNIFFTCIM